MRQDVRGHAAFSAREREQRMLGADVVVSQLARLLTRAVDLTPDSVGRLDPAEAVMSAVRPTGRLADVRAATCSHGHFFSSAAATTEWAGRHPDGYIHAVEDAFRLDRQVITRLGWEAR